MVELKYAYFNIFVEYWMVTSCRFISKNLREFTINRDYTTIIICEDCKTRKRSRI